MMQNGCRIRIIMRNHVSMSGKMWKKQPLMYNCLNSRDNNSVDNYKTIFVLKTSHRRSSEVAQPESNLPVQHAVIVQV